MLQGLKINIGIHLMVLISLAMIMVNVALITSFQKIYIHREMTNGESLISFIRDGIASIDYGKGVLPDDFSERLTVLLEATGYTCGIILNDHNERMFEDPRIGTEMALLEADVVQSMHSGEKVVRLAGETWGVFWKADKYLLIGFPLIHKGVSIGGVGLVADLSPLYRSLRQMQTLLWLFMAVALLVLTFLGSHQLSKITIKPIHRLLKRAEEFEVEDTPFFNLAEENNEFQRLSFSLNQMLMRINRDKQVLQETVASLETSNTELKQAQRDIIKAEKLASLGRLSAGIAHEIGNPISIILGYIGLLKNAGITGEESAEYLTRAEKETERVKQIIRKLLDYSRPANEEEVMFSIHRLLEDVVHMVRPQPLMDRITIDWDLDAEADFILGNPHLLQQVFLNLIINAADAISSGPDPANGRITIQTKNHPAAGNGRPDRGISIKFIDNGSGIPDRYLESLFDPFFTTKAPGKGTGLGLYVSFMIVENMGGTIEAASPEGNGTTLTVHLAHVSGMETPEPSAICKPIDPHAGMDASRPKRRQMNC